MPSPLGRRRSPRPGRGREAVVPRPGDRARLPRHSGGAGPRGWLADFGNAGFGWIAEAVRHHIDGGIAGMDDYAKALPALYPDHTADFELMRPWAERQARGEVVVWTTLVGFFWFPRTLTGIEGEIHGFFDQPGLIHRTNNHLWDFNVRAAELTFSYCVPTFVTNAEDMSYNHVPVLSRKLFDERRTIAGWSVSTASARRSRSAGRAPRSGSSAPA